MAMTMQQHLSFIGLFAGTASAMQLQYHANTNATVTTTADTYSLEYYIAGMYFNVNKPYATDVCGGDGLKEQANTNSEMTFFGELEGCHTNCQQTNYNFVKDFPDAAVVKGPWCKKSFSSTTKTKLKTKITAWEDDRGDRCTHDTTRFGNSDDCYEQKEGSFTMQVADQWQRELVSTQTRDKGVQLYTMEVWYKFKALPEENLDLEVKTCDVKHANTDGVVNVQIDGGDWIELNTPGNDRERDQVDKHVRLIPPCAKRIVIETESSDGWCMDSMKVDGQLVSDSTYWFDKPCDPKATYPGGPCKTTWEWTLPESSKCPEITEAPTPAPTIPEDTCSPECRERTATQPFHWDWSCYTWQCASCDECSQPLCVRHCNDMPVPWKAKCNAQKCARCEECV